MKIELHTYLKVRLTVKAIGILRGKCEGVFVTPPANEDGYTEWQFYRLMNKFGAEIDVEAPNDLFDGELILVD